MAAYSQRPVSSAGPGGRGINGAWLAAIIWASIRASATGWGLIEARAISSYRLRLVETSERAALGARLVAIHDGLIAVIERYRPHEAAVENTFVNSNAAATLKLGQARGIAMLVPARAGLTVAEYAPNLVKKSIVGSGHAEKTQIRMMIGVLLPKADPQSEDAADALAIAICHAHHRSSALLRWRRHDRQAERYGRHGVDFVILDVGGVGYQVHCSARTMQALPSAGEPATLSIETYVRADQIKRSASASDSEREWFRLLQTVQGVGAKVALSVLGTLTVSELASAVAMRDKATVSRSPGVGAKVAERIVTELKDKVPAFADIDPAAVHLAGALDEKRAPRPVMDAVSALVNLGYGQPQAAAAIAAATRNVGEGADVAMLIRQGLKELAR